MTACDNGKLSSNQIWASTPVNITSHKALVYDFCPYYERSYVHIFHSATFMLQNILNTLKQFLYWYKCQYIQSLLTDGRMHVLNFFVTVLRTFHFPAKAVISHDVNQGVRNGRGMWNANEINTWYKSVGNTTATKPLVKLGANERIILEYIQETVCVRKWTPSIHMPWDRSR